jgi:3-isopropylmalate/(R)-2-methylmalate dehydratase large subunit
MAMTLLEKLLAAHSKFRTLQPGEIVDIEIDIRTARDFGGANVVKNIKDHNLKIKDPEKTLFTFDCNPTGSDQKYAVNQHVCRLFARENDIKVFDIDAGIGTHIMIDEGYVSPGATAVSTDSHANILGAIGAFGQGMGDMDIAASWHQGSVWFRIPPSAKIQFTGEISDGVSSKDIILNLLGKFGADTFLGYSIELYGEYIRRMPLDDRITISSMATEMGAIIILFPPSDEIIEYCRQRSGNKFSPVFADEDATYSKTINIDISGFNRMVARPGKPHDTVNVSEVQGQKIDSAFIGSCTNGRMGDMRKAAALLKNKRIAPGVILKIVPATDKIWKECLNEGLIDIFKKAGALVSNAGCAGCAAGQVGQNGLGEVTISSGNRNFPGKQGKGDVFLASPEIVAASAIAGYITTPDNIPAIPALFKKSRIEEKSSVPDKKRIEKKERPFILEGRTWIIAKNNIDTDMIFHNRYLSITDPTEMGKYTFDNLEGFKDFAGKVIRGDIIVTGRNFGCGSSRQQAVDCFLSLGIQGIIAESFGAIYERNAINAALPVITCKSIDRLALSNGDRIRINLKTGEIKNLENNKSTYSEPFSAVQYEIYQKGSLFA